jgi:hypothetical protein
MSFLNKLDRRFIFVLLILIVALPLIAPFPVIVPISSHTQNYYNVINSLKPGSTVLFVTDVSTKDAEMYPIVVATLIQLMERQSIVILYNFFQQGETGTLLAIKAAGYDALNYGTDFVDLGFVPGEDATLSSFLTNMVGTRPKDYAGNPTATMPIFQKINSIQDIDLVIGSGAGTPGADAVAKIAVIPYNKLAIMAVPGSQAGSMYNFIQLGVYRGGLLGQRTIVEYERLIGHPGYATSLFAPLWLSHVVIVLIMVSANAVLWYRSWKAKGGKK